MRAATIILTALALVAPSLADDVPEGIAPPGGSPDGCEQSVDGNFTIGISKTGSSKLRRETGSEAINAATVCSLKDGVLKDANGRIGSIVANNQFQFDGPPPQAGAIYTGGFSVCGNNSLAIGPSTRWWRCMSGDFGNLYNEWIGDQCSEVRILAGLSSSSSSSSSTASSTSTSASSSASDSATVTTDLSSTIAPSTTAASNATVSSGSHSSSGSLSTKSAGTTTPVADAPNAQSTGAAVTTRAPKRETFGAVIGILGAALIL
ncbi:hypothetical protein K491DRAFT_605324 [Lophiostoma macrostomum CBS 122681]|uniref:Cell wall mannoprotein PIR1-like C-terminal domain-containing protein n=1 Tax=Lophiostoma macrostomum CBS 122681 TaxID=1314788 RepID=A0A6A6SWS2_9PLEO|nr:hypothetical protein K491DRAFT_605324 [Lophiostoma macrostomum CBS 122681]